MKDIEKQERDRFKDHVILNEKQLDEDTRLIVWSQPNSGICRINYILRRNTLIVFGDMYDAVYHWSSKLTLDFLAGLDIGYFASKCQASPNGRGFERWSQEKALKYIQWYCKSHEGKSMEQFEDLYGEGALNSQTEWCLWLNDNGDKFFGPDWMELGDIGMQIAWECWSHLIGLKMIHEKLSAEAAA